MLLTRALVLAVPLSLTSLACSGAPDSPSSVEITLDTKSKAQAVRTTRFAYNCDDRYCTCTGDDDCNDMFEDGVCGPKAICQISPTDIPRCRCSAVMLAPARSHAKSDAPVLVAE